AGSDPRCWRKLVYPGGGAAWLRTARLLGPRQRGSPRLRCPFRPTRGPEWGSPERPPEPKESNPGRARLGNQAQTLDFSPRGRRSPLPSRCCLSNNQRNTPRGSGSSQSPPLVGDESSRGSRRDQALNRTVTLARIMSAQQKPIQARSNRCPWLPDDTPSP